MAARADSLRRRRNSGHFWTKAQIPLAPREIGAIAVIPDSIIEASVEPMIRDVLLWATPLQSIPSGEHNMPDPEDAGDLPGREPPEPMIDVLPESAPGFPEMPPDAVAPLWLSRITLLSPDPLSLPSNPTGGPLLEMQLAGPDSATPYSGVRLLDQTNKRHTEEAFIAKPLPIGLLRFYYGDHKTEGREIYGKEFGENLLARFDRGQSWGGWRIGWQNQEMRALNSFDGSYFFWNHSALMAGGDWLGRHATADLALQVFWDRAFDQVVDGISPMRKDSVYRGLLRVAGRDSTLRPLLTVQFDRVRQRFDQPSILELDRTGNGIGVAAGLEGVTKNWRFRGSAGRSEPAPGRSGAVGAIDVERRLGSGIRLIAHADRSVRPLLLPRLADEWGVLVGEGLTVPEADPNRKLEEINRASLALERTTRKGATVRLEGRALEIRHTVSAAGGLLHYFNPGGRGSGGYDDLVADHPEALDRTVRMAGVSLRATAPLGRGFRIEGLAEARVSDPGWRDQLWMTPWNGEAQISYERLLFKRDLLGGLFLRGRIAGERAAPEPAPYPGASSSEIIFPWSRFLDAGATARVRKVTLFAMLVNLEDSADEAGAYEAGWVYLPFRSYRIGLTWHFLD